MRKLIIVASVLSLVGFLLIPGGFAQTETTPGTSREPSLEHAAISPSLPSCRAAAESVACHPPGLSGLPWATDPGYPDRCAALESATLANTQCVFSPA